jgi:hypothetical protein
MVAELIRTGGAYTVRAPVTLPDALTARLRAYSPRNALGRIVRAAFAYLPPDLAGELLDAITRCVVVESALGLTVIRRDGRVEDLGIVSRKVITTAGVNFLVDAWQNLVELEILRYHGIGTGSTTENVSDTALVTELTTEYNPDNTRATGSLTEGAGANVFRTVGTNTLDGTPGAALREHGIFSQAGTGGGTLWDRSVYGAITLSSGDGLQSTYDMTASSGG